MQSQIRTVGIIWVVLMKQVSLEQQVFCRERLQKLVLNNVSFIFELGSEHQISLSEIAKINVQNYFVKYLSQITSPKTKHA